MSEREATIIQANLFRLDKSMWKDQVFGIVSRAQKHQRKGNISDFTIGVSKEGKPNKPGKWLLYSPSHPPKISKNSGHESKVSQRSSF
jgi:hypothetical protein